MVNEGQRPIAKDHDVPDQWKDPTFVQNWVTRDDGRIDERAPMINDTVAKIPFERDAVLRVLDVGGGTSFLADRLLALGYKVGVMDISEVALDQSKARLGTEATAVEWIHADVLNFVPRHPWDVWHDRAVFHFLTDQRDRLAYKSTLLRTLASDGVAVIATFGPNAPERCSGLPTVRYSAELLARELGEDFVLTADALELHRTPRGETQAFVYCAFRRAAA